MRVIQATGEYLDFVFIALDLLYSLTYGCFSLFKNKNLFGLETVIILCFLLDFFSLICVFPLTPLKKRKNPPNFWGLEEKIQYESPGFFHG